MKLKVCEAPNWKQDDHKQSHHKNGTRVILVMTSQGPQVAPPQCISVLSLDP